METKLLAKQIIVAGLGIALVILLCLTPIYNSHGLIIYKTFFWLILGSVFATYPIRYFRKDFGEGLESFIEKNLISILIVLSFSLLYAQLYLQWSLQYPGNDFIIGNLIPVADSRHYLAGAIGFDLFNEPTFWSDRRPLNHLFFSGLFKFSGENLENIFYFLLVLYTILISSIAFCISKGRKKRVAFYTVLVLFTFIKPYWGSFLSENAGYIAGLVGALLIVQGLKNRINLLYPLGIGFIVLGLSARSGSYFVPLFLSFAVLIFNISRKDKIKYFILSFLFLGGSSFINKGVRTHYNIEGSSFSNFGVTLYGIARGGKGWTQFSEDYPKFTTGWTANDYERLNVIIKNSILTEPHLFIKGLFRSMNAYVFNYMTLLPKPFKIIDFLLFGFYLFFIFRKYKKREALSNLDIVIGLAFFGNLIASSVVGHDGKQRVFAATISFNALLYAFSLDRFTEKFFPKTKTLSENKNDLSLVTPGLVTASIVGLIFLYGVLGPVSKKYAITAPTCNEGEEAIVFFNFPEANLHVGYDKGYYSTGKTTTHEHIINLSSTGNQSELLKRVHTNNPYTLTGTYEALTNNFRFLRFYAFPQNLKRGFVQGCKVGHQARLIN